MTAVATRSRPAPDPVPTAKGSLAGSGPLIRFVLRRERVRLPLWIIGIVATTSATAGSFGDLYPPEARGSLAESMNSAAGLAMSGPAEYLADYHIGAMMGHQMLGFTAVLVAVMSIMMVVRHTRTEEESGRAELVRANVVGRHAHLTAVLIVAVGANLALAVLMAAGLGGLGLDGVTWGGSILYGVAHAAVGVAFAGVAAVTVQITEHPRGASGMAFGVLGLAYVLRAAGDAGDSAASWLSPIGWAQATYVFVADRWWPLLLPVALAAVLAAGAVSLSLRRDVGAGLRQPKPGAARASALLAHPVGMAVRLHRGLFVGAAVAMMLIGMSYGSILGDVEGLLGDVEMIEEALAEVGGATVVESFTSMIMMVVAVITSIYVVLATLRPRSEEQAGRAEPLLATPLSRSRWLGSHLMVAMIGGALVMVLAGLALGATGAAVLGDAGFTGVALGSAVAYVPALWVTSGVTVALYGIAPRLAMAAWAVPLYAFIVGYLGQLLRFPQWSMDVSPFAHVPRLPADDFSVVPLVVLTVVAAALMAVGFVGLRRRDIITT